ncbi:alpha/beta fold hydrolase [Cellulomonas sp. URHB0016]
MNDPRTAVPACGTWVVESHGDPGGSSARVLVHGIGMSARYFRRLTAELATDGRVLVPELPGCGRTPRTARAPRVDELADGLAAELDARDVRGATLVGHSMGAQVATELACRRPDLAGRLVLLSPVVDDDARSGPAQGLRLARDTLREPLGANLVTFTDYLRAGPRWYLAQLPHMLGYRLEERLPDVRCPVVVVRGERDMVAPQAWVARLAGLAPDGHAVVVPGAAHVVMYSRPELVARLCRGGLA